MDLGGYLLSLPERFLRAFAAAVGGLIYEVTQALLPHWVRHARLYKALIDRLLRILIEAVGDVRGVMQLDEIDPGELVLRKAAGNVIEVAGFLAMGWSPLWLLAAAADITGGTQVYLHALVSELQRAGLLKEDADITSADELLHALEGASGVMADLVDVPPLNTSGMRASLRALRQNMSDLPNASRLADLYRALRTVSREEGYSIGAVSEVVAVSAARAGVQLGQAHIFDFYRESLRAIQAEGIATYIFRVARPYFVVARSHFSPQRVTRTERALGYLRRRRKPE